jgi:hypothetical protein
MASTRNKNSLGDYNFEQTARLKQTEYATYAHGSQGMAVQTNFAGDGLIHGRIASSQLSQNSCDIESFLFGIGSVNLVNPKPDPVPQLKHLPSLSIIDKTPLLLPKHLVIEPNQRMLRD